MENKVRQGYQKDLALLFSTADKTYNISDIVSDYVLPINIMKAYPRGWNGYEIVDLSDPIFGPESTTVFKEFTKYYSEQFFCSVRSYDISVSQKLLAKIKRDIDWWYKEQGAPPSDKGVLSILNKITNFNTNMDRVNHDHHGVSEEWYNTWIESGLIDKRSSLTQILARCIHDNNLPYVEYLLEKYNLDINNHCNPYPTKIYLERGIGCYSTGVGYFANTVEMAKLLTKFGIDWGAKDSLNNSTYVSLLYHKAINSELFNPMLSYLRETTNNSILKRDALELELITQLEANNKSSVKSALSSIDENWWKLRNDKGENLLHILARHHYKLFIEYAKTKAGINLINNPNNDGRYPLEYLIAFNPILSSNKIKDDYRFKNRINNLLNKNSNLSAPKWSSIRCIMLANKKEIDLTRLDCSFWNSVAIKENYKSFNELFSSKDGKMFFDFLYSNFYENIMKGGANPDPDIWGNIDDIQSVIYMSDIIARGAFYPSLEYADPSRKSSFLKTASNVKEVELALMQSWHVMSEYILHSRSSYDERKKCEIENTIESLTYKAMNLDIDVIAMKKKTIEYYKRLADNLNRGVTFNFEESMDKKNIHIWTELETIAERDKLAKMVKNNKVSSESVTICNSAL